MHISDGILSMPVVVGTSAAALGLVGFSLKGLEEKEIPKIALMSAAFFVGSFVHFNVGFSSVHLLLSGVIGFILGRRTPIAISVALILQLLILQFGGFTSLGANILNVSIPAMLLSYCLRPYLGKGHKHNFFLGAIAGGGTVLLTILLICLTLLESNARFGIGIFSTIDALVFAHVPVMVIEAIVTGFIVQMMMQTRPDVLNKKKEGDEVA